MDEHTSISVFQFGSLLGVVVTPNLVSTLRPRSLWTAGVVPW